MKLAGQFDVIIVRAGIARIYMLYRMRELGLSTREIESAADNVSGFPNFFTITGPGSPSVTANMVVGIEQHVEWITAPVLRPLRRLRTPRSLTSMSWPIKPWPIPAIRGTWGPIPGTPRVFMPYLGGFPPYVEKCQAVANGYEGFVLS